MTRRTFVGKVMSLLFNTPYRLVITFLPRSKCLLISRLQSPSAVILEPKKIKSDTVSTVSPTICNSMNYSSLVSLSFTIFKSLLKLMCIVSDAIQPSHPLPSPSPPASIFPSIRVFSNESVLRITWPNIGVSASASVLPMTTQD